MKTLHAIPLREITVSAQQLLKMAERGEVMRSEFVPPRVGSAGFGSFRVELARPTYVVPAKRAK